MIARQKLLDALDLMRCSGVRRLDVTPEFYVGFVRWWAGTITNSEWPNFDTNYLRARTLLYTSDDDIVDERLGDALTYCGISVRLAAEFR